VTVVALCMDWKITLTAIVITPLIVLLVRILGKRIGKANKRALMNYARMLGAMESTLTGMRVVKATGERTTSEGGCLGSIGPCSAPNSRWAAPKRLRRLSRDDRFCRGGPGRSCISRATCSASRCRSGFHHHDRVVGGHPRPGPQINDGLPEDPAGQRPAERVFEIIDSPTRVRPNADKPRIFRCRSRSSSTTVSFIYPQANRQSLCNVSLNVRAGEIVALVGSNGSARPRWSACCRDFSR